MLNQSFSSLHSVTEKSETFQKTPATNGTEYKTRKKESSKPVEPAAEELRENDDKNFRSITTASQKTIDSPCMRRRRRRTEGVDDINESSLEELEVYTGELRQESLSLLIGAGRQARKDVLLP
jgi:hypothetical protein